MCTKKKTAEQLRKAFFKEKESIKLNRLTLS